MADLDRLKWDERYRGSSLTETIVGNPFPTELLKHLPASGRLLDVAGGKGADAIWFAMRGYDVTLVDISAVALDLARQAADLHGVTIATGAMDLDDDFPAGPWDVIHCRHYIDRALFTRFAAELATDGILALCHPTKVNLERHSRPSGRYLYKAGEMRTLVEASGLVVLHSDEGWAPSGHHEARVIARPENRSAEIGDAWPRKESG